MVDWPRPEVNGHLLNEGNLGLVFMRQVASGDEYTHFMVSRVPVDNRACYSNKGIMALAPSVLSDGDSFVDSAARPNFSRHFLKQAG